MDADLSRHAGLVSSARRRGSRRALTAIRGLLLAALLTSGLASFAAKPAARDENPAAADRNAPVEDATQQGLVALGRALYRGSQAARRPARLHGVELAATACIQCHGPTGEARTEAGITVPAITRARLSQADSRRAAYDDDALLRALGEGIAPGGRVLSAPMPRFTFDDEEARALLAWLKVLGSEAAPVPGVTPGQITIGAVLPLSGPQAEAGAAIRRVLTERTTQINREGGLFGRRVAVIVVDGGAGPTDAATAARRLVAGGQVFVLATSLIPEADAALHQALLDHDSALIATLGQPTLTETDHRVSWLLPALEHQIKALSGELTTRCAGGQAVPHVLYAPTGPVGRLLAASQDTTPSLATRSNWTAVTDVDSLDRGLAAAQGAPVLALLPGAWVARVRASAGASRRCLGSLAVLSGTAGIDAGHEQTGIDELLGLPMPAPALPLPEAAGAAPLWTALAERSVDILLEALSRSGRRLDTGRLLAALDSMQPPPPQPAFSRNRRHGFEPSWIWKQGRHHETNRQRFH